MATKLLSFGNSGIRLGTRKFQNSEELVAPGNGEWFILPAKNTNSVILSSTGNGRIEITNASQADINNDTVPATEIVPWSNGNIGVSIMSAAIIQGSAFRQVNISGTTHMSLSISK